MLPISIALIADTIVGIAGIVCAFKWKTDYDMKKEREKDEELKRPICLNCKFAMRISYDEPRKYYQVNCKMYPTSDVIPVKQCVSYREKEPNEIILSKEEEIMKKICKDCKNYREVKNGEPYCTAYASGMPNDILACNMRENAR